MSRLQISRLAQHLTPLREKLFLDARKRLLLLLVFFNLLLGVILALSVRNQEIQRSIRVVQEEIRYRIEQLATLQSADVQIVYVTATPIGLAAAPSKPATVASATSQPSPTHPRSTATSTPRPQRTRRPTFTPTRPERTTSPAPTETPVTLTATQSPTPTSIPTMTWTPVPTWTSVPLPTSTPTLAPTPAGIPSSLSLTSSSPELVADGSSTVTVRAEVLDQYGRTVSDGTPVTFSTDRGTFWGAFTVVVLTQSGTAQTTLTSSTATGTATIRATVGDLENSIHIDFSPGSAHTLSLTILPNRLTVGQTALIRASVYDSFGNRVADGTSVQFSTSLGTLSTDQADTYQGSAEIELACSQAGTATVSATANGHSATANVEWMPSVRIQKSVHRAEAPAGSVLTYTISIQNTSLAGSDAIVVQLQDHMPAGFTYITGSTRSSVFVYEPSIQGQQLEWRLSPAWALPANSTMTTSFAAVAQSPEGTLYNQAAVTGSNFEQAGTGAAAPITLFGPRVTAVVPSSACNDTPSDIMVHGDYLAEGAQARLGDWRLTTTWINEQELVVHIPPDIPAGQYDLQVTNPGGASSGFSGAFESLNCGSLDTTLDSGYLGTYGAEPSFSPAQGDDDQAQVLFLSAPAETVGPLYIRIFDPDCGGALDVQNGWSWNTPFTYTVYGGTGAYTEPDATTPHPISGADSGTLLASYVLTESAAYDASWLALGPFDISAGEPAGQDRVFKLTVQSGPKPPFVTGHQADLNLYNVAWSTSPTENKPPDKGRIWAYSWTMLIPGATYTSPPRLHAYIGDTTTTFTQHNWDYDRDPADLASAGITITTPLRTIAVPASSVSGNDQEQSSAHLTDSSERQTTWAISGWAQPTAPLSDNLVTFWATDQDQRALAIFARSTINPPP